VPWHSGHAGVRRRRGDPGVTFRAPFATMER
jgi:hypothetical protein